LKWAHAESLLAGARAFAGPCAGCAVHPAPTEGLREAYAAIARAVDAGAEQYAPQELAQAREKVALAERQIAARDFQPARWLVEQALVDAELAAVKAAVARAGRREGRQ